MASGHRRSIHISSAMFSSTNNASLETMKIVITNAFKQRFLEASLHHVKVWNMDFLSIEFPTTYYMEVFYTEKEIFNALKDANGDKVPWSDGFHSSLIDLYSHYLRMN